MKHIVTFFVCLLSLNAIIGLSGLAAWFGTWWLSIAAAIVLSLGLIVAGFLTRRGALLWAAFAGCFGAILGNQMLFQAHLLLSRPIVENARVETIQANPAAAAFTLVDARVRDDLRGYHHTSPSRSTRHRGSSRGRDIYAAPLVDSTWTTEQPVAAWVVCGEVPGCRENWRKQPGAAIRMDPGNQDLESCLAAAEDAAERHGLKIAPSPVFLEWAASWESYLSEQVDFYKFTVVTWNLVWFAPWLVWRIIALFRRKSAAAQPSPAGN